MGRLDHHGEADFFCLGLSFGKIVDSSFGSAQNRDFGFDRDGSSGCLVAQVLQRRDGWSDELDTRFFAGTSELGSFGKEPVTGMNCVDSDILRQSDDSLDIQIRPDRLTFFAHLVGFVCFEAVQSVAVFVRVNGNGRNAQLRRAAEDSNGDFRAVGYEKFLK